MKIWYIQNYSILGNYNYEIYVEKGYKHFNAKKIDGNVYANTEAKRYDFAAYGWREIKRGVALDLLGEMLQDSYGFSDRFIIEDMMSLIRCNI